MALWEEVLGSALDELPVWPQILHKVLQYIHFRSEKQEMNGIKRRFRNFPSKQNVPEMVLREVVGNAIWWK